MAHRESRWRTAASWRTVILRRHAQSTRARLSPPPRPEQRRNGHQNDADDRRRHPAGAVAFDAATEVHFELAGGAVRVAGGGVKLLRFGIFELVFKALVRVGVCDDRFDVLTYVGRADDSSPSRAASDGEAAVENRFETLTGQIARDCC